MKDQQGIANNAPVNVQPQGMGWERLNRRWAFDLFHYPHPQAFHCQIYDDIITCMRDAHMS